ncbi:MAG TPA: hypothetical protein VEI02_12265, partial [Planctomycetota bacterium]|nr:hypothetical protein [Planctomycetota bacterium]
MASATGALERLRKFMDDADPNAQRLLRNLADGTADLRARLDVFEAMAAEARKLLSGAQPLVADLAGMTAENRANFAEMVRTFRNTAWELELAMRKIRANPAVLLFGDDEQDLSAEPRDASGLRRSGRARPYGQRDESERGSGK